VFHPTGWRYRFPLALSGISLALLVFSFCALAANGFVRLTWILVIGWVAGAFAAWPFVRRFVWSKNPEFFMLTSDRMRLQSRSSVVFDIKLTEIEQIRPDSFLDVVFLVNAGSYRHIPGYFRPKGWSIQQFGNYIAECVKTAKSQPLQRPTTTP
jgi:hypothetical protein